MPRPPKIDRGKLLDFLKVEGNTKQMAADRWGVSLTSIYRALEKIKSHVPKVIAIEHAATYAKDQFDLVGKYIRAMDSLETYRDKLEGVLYRGDKKAFAQLQRIIESKSAEAQEIEVPVPGKEGNKQGSPTIKMKTGPKTRVERRVEDFIRSDLHAQLIRVNAEIRGYLTLQVEIYNACADPKTMLEILNVMIEEIGRVSPETRTAIETRLKRHSLIRSVIGFDLSNSANLRIQDRTGENQDRSDLSDFSSPDAGTGPGLSGETNHH